LPKYRGAAPIQWAIANGETVSGNTTMRLNEGLDTGDILLQQELLIAPDDTALSYGPRLAEAGADLTIETLRGLEHGSISPHPQDHSRATLAPILTKDDGRIDFTRTAKQICDRLRGFQPWPGAYAMFRDSQLKVIAAKVAPENIGFAPGALKIAHDRLLVGCAAGTVIEVMEIQPEGKKRMSARDFANGQRLQPGEKLS
jgi:methionyl-tRNA formyltransferase